MHDGECGGEGWRRDAGCSSFSGAEEGGGEEEVRSVGGSSVSSLGIDGADMLSTGQLIANDIHDEFLHRPNTYQSPYKHHEDGTPQRHGGRV